MQGLKDKNLDSEVKPVLKFVTKTVSLFKIIGKKFGLAVQSLTDILAFTFLSLPVMNIIRDLADHKGFNIDRVDDLLMGLTLSAGTYTLKNIMKRK